jgi:lipopolysaccharide export system permease protein
MQAAGLSRFNIIKSVMKTALFLIVISMSVGELLAPSGEAKAREIRAQAISGGSLIAAKNGVWAKDGDYFVNIGEVLDKGQLKKIEIYGFNEQLKIDSWLSAEQALYKSDHWLLFNVEEFVLRDDKIITQQYQTKMWNSSLTPNKLGVVTVTPESLSIRGLIDYLDYLEANQQDPSRYQLAFWRKIMQPFTVAVMLLVALSFIFGPLRSVSMGARIMMGVFTGILFFISNEVLGSLSLVYQLSPMFGAIMPSIIFTGVAWYLMAKKNV